MNWDIKIYYSILIKISCRLAAHSESQEINLNITSLAFAFICKKSVHKKTTYKRNMWFFVNLTLNTLTLFTTLTLLTIISLSNLH